MSNLPTSITNVNDERLIQQINRATKRLVLLCPGVSEDVAKALEEVWKRLGGEHVTVIVDADPEVCRLGYGTLEGLKILHKAAASNQTMVHQQPGMRLGLLVTDGCTLIFSPTPLLIEAGSTRPEHPNGLVLQDVPESVAKDLGLGDQPHLQRTLGMEPMTNQHMAQLNQSLNEAPPVKFDVHRHLRVVTMHFQYVELEVKGCQLSRRKVRIPPHLLGMVGNKTLEQQLHAQFELLTGNQLQVKAETGKNDSKDASNNQTDLRQGIFDKVPTERFITEASIERQRREIQKKYLIQIPGYGWMISRKLKEQFEKDIETMRKDIMCFSNGMKKQLCTILHKSRRSLYMAMKPAIIDNPPTRYLNRILAKPPEKRHLRRCLVLDLCNLLGKPQDYCQAMEVKYIYKDVTIESLSERAFRNAVRKAMPYASKLHAEFTAIAATNMAG